MGPAPLQCNPSARAGRLPWHTSPGTCWPGAQAQGQPAVLRPKDVTKQLGRWRLVWRKPALPLGVSLLHGGVCAYACWLGGLKDISGAPLGIPSDARPGPVPTLAEYALFNSTQIPTPKKTEKGPQRNNKYHQRNRLSMFPNVQQTQKSKL